MSMPKLVPLILLLSVALGVALSGCSLGGYTLTRQAAIDAQIEAARVEAATKMEALRTKETQLLTSTISQHEAREQAAADYLFKGFATYGSLAPDQVSRPTLIMGQSINLTATQLPPATPAAQAAAFKALQTELDTAKVTTEQLKTQYAAELAKAREEGAAKERSLAEAAKELKAVEVAKIAALQEAATKEAALQRAKDTVQDQGRADAERRAADAAKNERLKMWLMGGLGVIALAAGAAAVWVPIPTVKRYGAIVGVAAAALGFSVPFIEPFHVLIAILCVCVPVGLRVIWVYKQERDVATSTYRAIQTVKDNDPETYTKAIQPVLTDWHSRYTKDGTKVPDIKAQALIDERLKETDAL